MGFFTLQFLNQQILHWMYGYSDSDNKTVEQTLISDSIIVQHRETGVYYECSHFLLAATLMKAMDIGIFLFI